MRTRGSPRVLVALIGMSRASELTADRFFSNVVDELDADLALCVRAGEDPNPFHERADHLWTFAESGDWAADYDEAAGNPDWRTLLEVPDVLMGIEKPGGPAVLYFYRRLLWRSIRAAGLADAYDWIVLTRSDFIWPVPHPDLRYLSSRRIHTLEGEHYGGVCDRHMVIPRRYFEPVLGELVEPVFTDAKDLRRRLERVGREEGWSFVNVERLLALRFRELGLWRRLRYLPYVPFLVRSPGGHTTWSLGILDEEHGYYVKYPPERERSEIALRFVGDQDSWRRHLAPVRGAPQRRRLRKLYRERGVYERPFSRRESVRSAFGGAPARAVAIRHGAAIRIGRLLRRVPGARAPLAARFHRLRRRREAAYDRSTP